MHSRMGFHDVAAPPPRPLQALAQQPFLPQFCTRQLLLDPSFAELVLVKVSTSIARGSDFCPFSRQLHRGSPLVDPHFLFPLGYRTHAIFGVEQARLQKP